MLLLLPQLLLLLVLKTKLSVNHFISFSGCEALRNTARALESENDLLSRERDSLEAEVHRLRVAEGEASARAEAVEVELKAKDRERAEFAERFRRMEQEKVNVSRRSAEVEAEAEEAREEARAERGAREAAEAGLDRALRRGIFV